MKLYQISELHRVFVYGSLKRGFGNHDTFLGDALFLSECQTDEQRFEMLSLNFFPGVVDGGENDVAGELYLVDDEQLKNLDMLEGNGVMYARELVWLKGEDLPAWVYIYLQNSTTWYNVSDAEWEHRKTHRIEVIGNVAKWLPDASPSPFLFSQFSKLREKWGSPDSNNNSASLVGDDYFDDSFEVDIDLKWQPEPEEVKSQDALDQPELLSEEDYTRDAEYKAMQEWLRKR